MKNFVLTFLFVPVVLAFAENGGEFGQWVFPALILLSLMASIIPTMFEAAAEDSEFEIDCEYAMLVLEHAMAGDASSALQHRCARQLFARRGM